MLGAEHPDTLLSMANLASIYHNLKNFKEAKELKVQVLEMRKKLLGAEHPDTLLSMGNLARTFSNLVNFKDRGGRGSVGYMKKAS